MEMDDDDFEDLLDDEDDLLQDSSQASLIGHAANLSFLDDTSIHFEEDASMFDCTTDRPHDLQHNELPESEITANSSAVSFDDHVVQPSAQPETPGQRSYPNAAVINKIEGVFELITDALLNDRNEISITLKTRKVRSKSQAARDVDESDRTKRLCFPGKSEEEAWRFSVVMRIMELMHEALRNDVVLSKRDIYYRDPALFGSQSVVDRYVDDIAFTFGVPRSALNVTAVAKGLFAGALKLHRRDGSIVAADQDREALLIPNLKDILRADLGAVRWILVIEKEATFRSIAASVFWKFASAEGILLTGKGYPDLSSRAFLHFLSTPSVKNGFASPPVFGLADFDPDGLAILSTYKHGSQALAHESSDHCVPSLQWLELRSEHLTIAMNDTQAAQGLLQLTARDRKKVATMLETSTDLEVEWKEELQAMLMFNTKAELQLLDAVPDGMMDLLTSTLGKL